MSGIIYLTSQNVMSHEHAAENACTLLAAAQEEAQRLEEQEERGYATPEEQEKSFEFYNLVLSCAKNYIESTDDREKGGPAHSLEERASGAYAWNGLCYELVDSDGLEIAC